MSQGQYSSYRLTLADAGVLLEPHDAFGSFEDFDRVEPMAPCRSIPITAEVLAREAALHAERERKNASPMQAWRDQVKLDPANLRRVRTRTLPGRVAAQVAVSKPERAMRPCGNGCGKLMVDRSTQTICKNCRPKLTKRKTCASCPREFDKYSPHATCRECRRAAKPRRECSTDGCGRTLKADNQSGLCFKCKDKLRSRALPMAQVACDGGCGRLLRRGRVAGRCGRCADAERPATARAATYRKRRNLKADRHCGACGVLIKWNSTTGMCGKHARKAKTCRTMLRAGSLRELEMDRAWAKLGADAKSVVLMLAQA